MNQSKTNLNPISIKNYLFEQDIVSMYTVSYQMVKVGEEELKEAHFNVTLLDDTLLDIYRSVKDNNLYINDKLVDNWETIDKILKS